MRCLGGGNWAGEADDSVFWSMTNVGTLSEFAPGDYGCWFFVVFLHGGGN